MVNIQTLEASRNGVASFDCCFYWNKSIYWIYIVRSTVYLKSHNVVILEKKSRDFLKRWQYNDIIFYLFTDISGVVDRK